MANSTKHQPKHSTKCQGLSEKLRISVGLLHHENNVVINYRFAYYLTETETIQINLRCSNKMKKVEEENEILAVRYHAIRGEVVISHVAASVFTPVMPTPG